MPPVDPQPRFAVLIIETDPNARKALEAAAHECGVFWSVRAMADGRWALEQLWDWITGGNEPVPDVIISGADGNGLDGLGLLRELRRYEETQRLFIALLPAQSDARQQDAAEAAGCDFYLPRPSSPERMIAALHSIAKRCVAQAWRPRRIVC